MDKRPKLNGKIKIRDFEDFYWLKEELVAFCRMEGLSTRGGKIEIANRIVNYLRTGEITDRREKPKSKPKSKFDWNRETLTLQTEITDSYKNTKNVREFFIKHVGKRFKFNVTFMNWMKSNGGRTLQDAIIEWERIEAERKNGKTSTVIAPQFEYNQYIRDFLRNNPDKTKKDAVQYWKIKRYIRGNNVYSDSDLELKVYEDEA